MAYLEGGKVERVEEKVNSGINMQFLGYNVEAEVQYRSVLSGLDEREAEELPGLNEISHLKAISAFNMSLLYKNKGKCQVQKF